MGWTITYDQHRLKSFLEDRTSGWDHKEQDGKISKKTVCVTYHYCMHNPGNGVLFKVMETQRLAPDEVTVVERERWIGVDLIKYYGGRNRAYGWGYKDMEASMGPTAHGCPLSYVDELVPDPGTCGRAPCSSKDRYTPEHTKACRGCHGCGKCWEMEWRGRVRAQHAAAKKQREFLKSLKPGDVIVIAKGYQGAGDHETVQEVYPRRRKLRAGGWLIPSKAIDIEASLLAVGIEAKP